MFDIRVTVKENKRVSPDLWVLSYHCPKVARKILPGQFLQFRLKNSTDPFLRRPFSVYKIKGDRIEVLYEGVGVGTKLMTQMKTGDEFWSLGPLGTSFTPVKKKKVLMVGGGVGAAPLVFMAQRHPFDKMLLGFRGKSAVLPKSEAVGSKSDWIYATNDGSVGHKGFVTHLMEDIIKNEGTGNNHFIYACGPAPMLYEVARIAKKYGVEGELSLEERMGCGVGACLGCVAETHEGFLASCKFGPVFAIKDLLLEGLKHD